MTLKHLWEVFGWECAAASAIVVFVCFAAYSIETILIARRCPGCRSVRHRQVGDNFLCMACGNVFGDEDVLKSQALAAQKWQAAEDADRQRRLMFIKGSDRDNAA